MAIIRITKKDIAEANRAREAALLKDASFRAYEEWRRRQRPPISGAKESNRIGDTSSATNHEEPA